MIISHQYRYLFIEIPLTGSWSIRHELCERYAGVPILHKHATYPEFAASATPAERDYFVFAAVRNPLDKVVSRYYKLKTDHKGAFSDPTSADALLTDYADHGKFEYVCRLGASFQQYFAKYHKRLYSDLIDVSGERLDFVLRFENLQEGFAEVLRQLGIEQTGTIPMMNETVGRSRDWLSYYTSDIVTQAQKTFAPFMEKWGYRFPSEWPEYQSSWRDRAEFRLLCTVRGEYLIHFRYSNTSFARAVRRLRARLAG